jgi:hypothetical protein
MVLKLIPIQRKQSLQVRISQKFAIGFMTFVIPTSGLARLCFYIRHGYSHTRDEELYLAAVPEQ